jgi:hypothetical protein
VGKVDNVQDFGNNGGYFSVFITDCLVHEYKENRVEQISERPTNASLI